MDLDIRMLAALTATHAPGCAGVGLFPTGALINHSCTPNAMQSFSQQRVTFTALQPIPPGTEITISYIELAATRAERRRQLLDQYYFDIDQGLQASSSLFFWLSVRALHTTGNCT